MITFLHPWALCGILAVAVPIAIHLIRERRRIAVVPSLLLFTNMRKITSRRKLEELFLLILRCLVILLITLLLAVPCLRRDADAAGASGTAEGITLGILMDDTPLAETTQQGHRVFDRMKRNALKRIRELSPDSVVLIGSAAAGTVSAPLTPKEAEKILESMEVLPQQGSIARAAAALAQALRTVDGTFCAAILVEAQPFAESWRNFRPEEFGLPLSVFHTDAELTEQLPDPFLESARRTGSGGEIELTLAGDCSPLPPGTVLEVRSAASGVTRTHPLPTGLQLKNTVRIEVSGVPREEALLLTLRTQGSDSGALTHWYLPPGTGDTPHSGIILLHDGTPETAYPVLTFHAALTLPDAKWSVSALNLRNSSAALKQAQCIIVPTMKHFPATLPEVLAKLLRNGTNLMIFPQKHPLELPGFSPEVRIRWRETVRSAAGFDLAIAQNMTARNLFFSVYAGGVSAVRLTELAAILPEKGDTEILHHATMPVLSIRPVDGGGNLILWGVPTIPLPLALTALPVFPELLSATLAPGERKQADSLFAGTSVNLSETLGKASGSAEVLEPGAGERTRKNVCAWTPEQPAELYLAQAGFHRISLTEAEGKAEKRILAVNLMRRTGGWLELEERKHLPQSAAPDGKLKLSTFTGDGTGNLNVTRGERINVPLTTPLTLALTVVLLLETVFSTLSSRRRREAEQC